MNQKPSSQILTETKALVLGHAIGDALGVPVEFLPRETLQADPVTDYRGYGTHYVPAGTWSDDTSMALATLDSLSRGIDYADMMQRFCNWERNAAYTATDEVFDMGITTSYALRSFRRGTDPLLCGGSDEHDNGNGSLMRIIPAVLYCRHRMADASLEQRMELIHNVSALTHRHPRSILGCGIYTFVLLRLLDDPTPASLFHGLEEARSYYISQPGYAKELGHYDRLFAPDFPHTSMTDIKSSGYVVATLEAAVWCLLNTKSYAECVLKAVNLGKDTDTVGAVAGGLAAAMYGLEGIPSHWIDGLLKKELLLELCEAFAQPPRPHPVTDAHCHIVFGVDDGCEDLPMSVEMLQEAYRQGTRTILCTSHDWGKSEVYPKHFEILRDKAHELGMELYTGSEIACSQWRLPSIQRALDNGMLLPLGNSKYILIEFFPTVSQEEFFRCIQKLNGYLDYRVVVAHVERCKFLQDNPEALRTLKVMGIPLQVNAYSLEETKDEGLKRLARTLLAEKMITFIGSDGHHPVHRCYRIDGGVEYIYAHCSEDYADDICRENARRMLLGISD